MDYPLYKLPTEIPGNLLKLYLILLTVIYRLYYRLNGRSSFIQTSCSFLISSPFYSHSKSIFPNTEILLFLLFSLTNCYYRNSFYVQKK